MLFFIIFLLELVVLFFLSQHVTRAISVLFYKLFRHEKLAISFFAFLFFPGTVLHELSHYVMAILLMVRVVAMEFVPKLTEGSVKLGSVQIVKTDPFRRALIGLAPLFVGLSAIFASLYYLGTFPFTPWYLNLMLLVIIIFEIGNTMFSSKRDVEGIPALFLAFIGLCIVLYFLGIRIPQSVWTYIFSPQYVGFLQQLCLYMLFPIGIDGILLFLSKIIKR